MLKNINERFVMEIAMKILHNLYKQWTFNTAIKINLKNID